MVLISYIATTIASIIQQVRYEVVACSRLCDISAVFVGVLSGNVIDRTGDDRWKLFPGCINPLFHIPYAENSVIRPF